MNLHKMAVDITNYEGKAVAINVAQVKEVLRITLDYLASMHIGDVVLLLYERGKKLKRSRGKKCSKRS